jgi:hypothetical protein
MKKKEVEVKKSDDARKMAEEMIKKSKKTLDYLAKR